MQHLDGRQGMDARFIVERIVGIAQFGNVIFDIARDGLISRCVATRRKMERFRIFRDLGVCQVVSKIIGTDWTLFFGRFSQVEIELVQTKLTSFATQQAPIICVRTASRVSFLFQIRIAIIPQSTMMFCLIGAKAID
jgi:hypothetical protein